MKAAKLFVILMVTAISAIAASSNPKDQPLSSDPAKWEEQVNPIAQKLPPEERQILARYLVRQTFNSAFSPGAKIPEGLTVGKAIGDQRKFEIEQRKREAAAKNLKEKVLQQRAEIQKQFDSILTVALISKKFSPADLGAGKYESSIDFLIAFKNNSAKDIAGVKGIVVFSDIFGDAIKRVRLSDDDSIQGGATQEWSGSINYNQFMDQDKKLANTDQSKLKFTFESEVVLFADGTRIEMPK